MQRICIIPKDIVQLIGSSERTSRSTYTKIMKYYKKEKHQIITIDEFCDYYGINGIKDIERVRKHIK
jgi:hypothetical protein